MAENLDGSAASTPASTRVDSHHIRFHLPLFRMSSVFGDDWFALKAERFARFFGTPFFLISQTVIVLGWIAINALGWSQFDIYPFILLNLAFSLQAAYAAPLILLAQTRQADRDKALMLADAQHREALAQASEQRAVLANEQSQRLLVLLEQNTQLTAMNKDMSQRIEALTVEIHRHIACR